MACPKCGRVHEGVDALAYEEALRDVVPADAFDELVGARATWGGYADRFEIVAGPGGALPGGLGPEDLLLVRALGEGRFAELVMPTTGEVEIGSSFGRAGSFVELRDGRRTLVADTEGRVPPDRMIVRLRGVSSEPASMSCPECGGAGRWAEEQGYDHASELHSHECRRGEGPPAAEPDPSGQGPHPTIEAGTTRERSRRPTVGYAQRRLNVFIERHRAGIFACRDTSAATRRYIEARFEELDRDLQLPLVVDCRFGPHTRRATQAFQACMGLPRSGVIDAEVWRLLDGVDQLTVFRLRVDANRDGVLDREAAPRRWTWGPSGRGAVVLVNNDDDDGKGRPDNEDDRINGGRDHEQIAPLAIERVGNATPPAGTRLELVIDRPSALRIFDGVTAGRRELVGPRRGRTHRFSTLPSGTTPMLLGMEGVRYAGRGFDGLVTITLRITPPTGSSTEVATVVRMAPWRMSSQLVRAERVFMVANQFNARLRRDLRAAVQAAGCSLVEHPITHGDIWMQDCMEIGSANLPNQGLRTVLRAPRDEPLYGFPRTLLGPELGFVDVGSKVNANTLDSAGNLEVSPPVTVAGTHYPFGRIYFCREQPTRDPSRFPATNFLLDRINVDLEAFLRGQLIQAPFTIDTSWLSLAHVDEVVSFVPAPGGKGFKLLIASTRRAYQILDALALTNPTDRVMTGRTFPYDLPPDVDDGGPRGREFNAEMTIREFLALQDDFHPLLDFWMRRHPGFHYARPLRDYNGDRQRDLDRIRAKMVAELGLVDEDIIEIPVVFKPDPDVPIHAEAMFPNMINMLVLNGHCIVPRPFGPVVGGKDGFEEVVRSELTPLGLTVRFVDCWENYHTLQGGIHCGTNTLRQHDNVRWWEFQPRERVATAPDRVSAVFDRAFTWDDDARPETEPMVIATVDPGRSLDGGPMANADGDALREALAYLRQVERDAERSSARVPRVFGVVEILSRVFGAGITRGLALRLVQPPEPSPWLVKTILAYLNRQKDPATTEAIVRFAARSPVPSLQEAAIQVLRGLGDPALAAKVDAERTRLARAGKQLPAAVAALGSPTVTA